MMGNSRVLELRVGGGRFLLVEVDGGGEALPERGIAWDGGHDCSCR